jgi:hypothetical protein
MQQVFLSLKASLPELILIEVRVVFLENFADAFQHHIEDGGANIRLAVGIAQNQCQQLIMSLGHHVMALLSKVPK